MAVSWAWASKSTSLSRNISETNVLRHISSKTSVLSSASSTTGYVRSHLRIWSRSTTLDTVICQLEEQPSGCGITIYTANSGMTEHEDAAQAISYLLSVRHQRRQSQLPASHDSQTHRRQKKSAPPMLMQNRPEVSCMSKLFELAEESLSDAETMVPEDFDSSSALADLSVNSEVQR